MMSNRVAAILLGLLTAGPCAFAGDYRELLVDTYPADGPGVAAIVVKNDVVLFEGASGMSNIELDVPLNPDSIFRIASITKQFTATAILLLEADGQLELEDLITEYWPDYPTHGYEITIQHLLTHTSGIANLTEIPEFYNSGLYRLDATTEETINFFKEASIDFAPGTDFKYSNSGYILLGAVIEKITGRPFHEFIAERIFAPLGMTSSFRDDGRHLIKNRASGYEITDAGVFNSPCISMSRPHAAGSLMSTVGDLAVWSQALFRGDVIDDPSLARMTTNHQLTNGTRTGYGYGLEITDLFSHTMFSHTGGISGFSGVSMWLPEEQVFVAVLSNATGHEIGPDDIAYLFALEAIGMENPFEADYEVSPEIMTTYSGKYRTSGEVTLVVTERDGVLFGQPTGDVPYELAPFAEDAFYYPGYFEYLEFKRDNGGEIVGVAIHYGPTEVATFAERVPNDVE